MRTWLQGWTFDATYRWLLNVLIQKLLLLLLLALAALLLLSCVLCACLSVRVHLCVQDMPGWGDDINLVNSLRTVVDFLLKQRQKDYIHHKAGLTGRHKGLIRLQRHKTTGNNATIACLQVINGACAAAERCRWLKCL